VRFVSGARQLVVNRQSHFVSLPFILQRPGQSVTHEMALAARTLPTRPARRRRAQTKKPLLRQEQPNSFSAGPIMVLYAK
jgi:hypothetical protein